MSMRYRVFNNVLSSSDYNPIVNSIVSRQMPFNYCNSIVGDYFTEGETITAYPFSKEYGYQFTNLIHDGINVIDSVGYNLVLPILNFLRITAIRRIKFNLTPRTPANYSNIMHVDSWDQSNYFSAVYYVNDNNGGTYFEDGTFVPSVANRLLVFEGNNKHTHITCTDQYVRMVVNFVVYLPNNDILTLPNYPSLQGI